MPAELKAIAIVLAVIAAIVAGVAALMHFAVVSAIRADDPPDGEIREGEPQ